MLTDKRLTQVHDERMLCLIEGTPVGAAHWAGTGPEGRVCGECGRFGTENQRAARSRGKKIGMGRCEKYMELRGASAKRFSGHTKACRYFDDTEST